MKKIAKIFTYILCFVVIFGVAAFMPACIGGEKNILVIAREDGSGTRDAFDSMIKNAEGVTLKNSKLVNSVEMMNTTGDVFTKVTSVTTALGYMSLGTMNDSVKAINVEGVQATAENVVNGTYKLWRPFVIMTNRSMTEAGTLTAASKDFIKYLGSSQAQAVVTKHKFIEVSELHGEAYIAPAAALSDKVVITGSTSVEPVITMLIADYQKIGGGRVSNVKFSLDCQGSSFGVIAAKSDTLGNAIGLSSTAVKSADESQIAHFNVALDAVAVVVNKRNALENISISQLYDVYTGSTLKFSELMTASDERQEVVS